MRTIEEQIRDAEGRLFARYDVSLTKHLGVRSFEFVCSRRAQPSYRTSSSLARTSPCLEGDST